MTTQEQLVKLVTNQHTLDKSRFSDILRTLPVVRVMVFGQMTVKIIILHHTRQDSSILHKGMTFTLY